MWLRGWFLGFVCPGRLGTTQTVDVVDSSQQSAAFSSDARAIRIVSTKNAWIEIGSDPTASASSAFLPEGIVDYLTATPGQKVAALKVNALDDEGVLSVSEIV